MKKFFAICICLFGIFVSCKKEEPMINVSQSSIEAESAGGTFTVQVVSNVEWSLLCSESWIKIKRESDNATITVTVSKNSGTDGRSGQIKLSSPEVSTVISVSQKQQNTIVLDGENLINVEDVESTFTVDTKTNTEYKVEIPSDAKWLSVVEGTKAMVPRTITFHADKNSGHESRSAQVYLTADKCDPVLIKITQMGNPYAFNVTLSGISKFVVPVINNNSYPATVLYNGEESEYSKGMKIQLEGAEPSIISFRAYQLIDVTFNDIIGIDEIDFSGM